MKIENSAGIQRIYAANRRRQALANAEKYGFDIFYIHRNNEMDRIFIGTREEWEKLWI